MIVSEAWIFFNPIFGRKERIVLWTVLSIQAILWTAKNFYLLIMSDSQINRSFLVVSVRVSAFLVLIYLFFIKTNIGADENGNKFKLFRNIYFFLFIYYSAVGILVADIFAKLTLFSLTFFECEPKKLNDILAFAYEKEELNEDCNPSTIILE